MNVRQGTPIAAAICCVAALVQPAAGTAADAAADYPRKPIRIIVPSAPSSGPDIVSRLLGGMLSEAWRQQVVADPRPGAAGNIATEIASNAMPDGYTLLMASSQQISGPLFFGKLPYDLIRDFLPICLIASTPYVLSVHPSVAAASTAELIALAKARPGTLHYGSSGMGGAPHLAAEMLKTMTNIDLVHVPYKSVVYALIDVIGGQIQLAFSVMPAALPMIKQGKLRALGVTSLKRTTLAPDLETIAEIVPGYEIIGWYGLVAPAGTPQAIIAKLNGETRKALQSGEMRQRLQAMGAEPIGTTPPEFKAFMSAQKERIAKIIQTAGLRSP